MVEIKTICRSHYWSRKDVVMFLYKIFKNEYVGTKKNSWTFVEINRILKGKHYYYLVLCVCKCGSQASYSPGYCMGPNFPLSCRKCNRARKKFQWKPALLTPNEREYELNEGIDQEQDDIVINYGNYYKDYYRD